MGDNTKPKKSWVFQKVIHSRSSWKKRKN